MNFGIQLQRNSARSFRVGKVPALLGQAGKALFLMKSTLQSLPLFPPCPGSRKEWLLGLKEFGRDVHGLVLDGETEFISSHGRRLSEASIWRLGLELQLVGLEASYSGLLVGQAGPPSSLRSNPSRQLWQPVLIALALIPVRGASARGKIAQTYIQGKDLRILYKKGKISKSRLGTSNRRIRKEERRVEKKGNEFFTKGGNARGTALINRKRGQTKEGTHLDRATTGDRIWKEINMFSRTNRLTPSMTAHQGNNGQSRQRQARMLLPTRPIQGNLTLCAENPSHFRQRGNDDGQPNREAKNSTAIHEGASGKSRAAPCRREGPRKVKSSAPVGVEQESKTEFDQLALTNLFHQNDRRTRLSIERGRENEKSLDC